MTLLELQRAIYDGLVSGRDGAAAAHILANGLAPEARLNIYRNTFVGTLTTALRLSYPAVHRLVGAPFFESAGCIFIESQPPRSAYLDEYGEGFADFLAAFAPAATLPYLPDVARLEWAVNRALHAPDAEALDLGRLAELDPANQDRLVLVPHPAIGLVHTRFPADSIWRAVLAQDDDAIAAINLGSGPAWLLVERQDAGVEVTRVEETAWRLMEALCTGEPLQASIEGLSPLEAPALLAQHLAAGRFVDLHLPTPESVT
jgi:hypothetical protein